MIRAEVYRSFYQDSVVLMRLAESLRALDGVREAAALMGSAANQQMLAGAGLATPETATATAGDLMLVVDAVSDDAAARALARGKALLTERQEAAGSRGRAAPRTIEGARRAMPDATLAMISVPGRYAAAEARRALLDGLHVFLFSDNVPLADEVELKRIARRRRLLCMGPDCGTAYLGGVPLGFTNVVPRGRVSVVAASGTGLQAVACHLAALGEGIAHGIGVGGRDLSAEVGGAMTTLALEALAADAATELVVVVSKPPAPAVLPVLEQALMQLGKPTVVCCLGAVAPGGGRGRWVATLVDAAQAAAAALGGSTWQPRAFAEPSAVRARLARRASFAGRRPGILGLYTGGTLAHEAALILEPLLGEVAHRFDASAAAARVIDLGDDEFTVGRPHPMIDPAARVERVRDAGRSREVGVLLLDLVLGHGAHADPAPPLAAAVVEARRAAQADGRSLAAVASVVGTRHDPQNLEAQIKTLEAADIDVLPSNAEAARFAAALAHPELGARIAGETR